MRYTLHHKTKYTYSNLVSYSQHLAHLRPLETANQRVLSYSLEVSPKPNFQVSRTDYYENEENYFSLTSPHDFLEVNSYAELEVTPVLAPALDLSPPWEQVRDRLFSSTQQATKEASEFTFPSRNCPHSREIGAFCQRAFTTEKPILRAALEFNRLIHEEFNFDPKATTVSTSVEEVYQKKAGVCQDYAHLQITALRSIGLAARYVSGYIRTDPPPGKPRLIGADASHAWISLYVPDLGWVDYDSTNNVIPSTHHITVAYGRDYDDICPIRGVVYGGGSQTLDVGVTLTPIEPEEKQGSFQVQRSLY